MLKKLIAAAALAAFALPAMATLQGGNTTLVQSVRYESAYAYITLNTPFTNCPRVYFDQSTATGKTNLAIALTAFITAKAIQIRAYDTDPKINGACLMFDIQVQN